MANLTVLAAATGLPTRIIPFPSDRSRPPATENGLFDKRTWDQCFVTLRTADQYRGYSLDEAIHEVVEMITAFGAASVAEMLEENSATLSVLRGLIASLTEADRRIALAADGVLHARGA